MIPAMAEIPAYLFKETVIKKIAGLDERQVEKMARSLIIGKNGRLGRFMTEPISYFLARIHGGTGMKKEGLPMGVSDRDRYWEGFRIRDEPVIVAERDYPGLSENQIADLFTAQAILLFRVEKNKATEGPDPSFLIETSPKTVKNEDADEEPEFDLMNRQEIMRSTYANTVLSSIAALTGAKAITFTKEKGLATELKPFVYGYGNKATGLALPRTKPSQETGIINFRVFSKAGLSVRSLLESSHKLAKMIDSTIGTVSMVCSKGQDAIVYIGGGSAGTVSMSLIYDIMAAKGRMVGSGAINSKITFKDIEFEKLRIVVDKESFTNRAGDTTVLPLSLDIPLSAPKVATNRAYEGTHLVGKQHGVSGMSIVPVNDPEEFIEGYHNHPSIVQYQAGEYVPAVIEFLRMCLVAAAPQIETPYISEGSDKWSEARKENTQAKEADVEDLAVAESAAAIPFGHEVVMEWDGNECFMHLDASGRRLTGTPQTTDFAMYAQAIGMAPMDIRGILCPTEARNMALLDKIDLSELPEGGLEATALFEPLEVQIYGSFEDVELAPLRGMNLPHSRHTRHMTRFDRDVSGREMDTSFAELIRDELESGQCSRILVFIRGQGDMVVYSEQSLNAVVIGYDIEGKDPQNGIAGKIMIALIEEGKVKTKEGRKRKAELYYPIGTTNAYRGFSVSDRRALLQHMMQYTVGEYNGTLLIDPSAEVVVRVEHKGILNLREQPVFRFWHSPRLKRTKRGYEVAYSSGRIPIPRGPLHIPGTTGPGLQAIPDEPKFIRPDPLGSGASPIRDPTYSVVAEDALPILRAPVVTGITHEIDGLSERFIVKDEVTERFTAEKVGIGITAPIEQLPFKRNPLSGFEPIIPEQEELDPGLLDPVGAQLTASLNPEGPDAKYTRHRQRVPWEFDQEAFKDEKTGESHAFVTQSLDKRRGFLTHIDGWNRRYDGFDGVKVVVGKLPDGSWSVQTILVPKDQKLRRTSREVRLDRKRPPKWYRDAHPNYKRYPLFKRNPVFPRDFMDDLDGYPSFMTQLTFSPSNFTGNPPKPPFALYFAPIEEKDMILENGIKETSIEMWLPMPNWKGPIMDMLKEMKKEGINNEELALFQVDVNEDTVEKIDKHKITLTGPIPASHIKELEDWWTQVDFETGTITDTPEYRDWMRASGYELVPWFVETNPKTPGGREFPSRYLKGLNKTERAIAMYEIDQGYKYDPDDPEAYEYWKSDIMHDARGMETAPSRFKLEFIEVYGPLPEGKDLVSRLAKATGIEKKYIQKSYNKGLAAWRIGHRPGVQQHQWAAGRAYAFVMGAESSTGKGKPDHKLAITAGIRNEDGTLNKRRKLGRLKS
jgi:hypothetical protein